MSIHDELERIAARAPEVVVPADTWARARRARRRERVGVVAAVVAVLAVAGTLVWLPTRDGVDPVDGRSLGVPSRLWAVPERMSDRENDGAWMRDEVTPDVATVGVGAAAWVTDGGLPVVVDARAGGYHLLDLPDFAGNNETFTRGLGDPVVALSPDGRRLAYGYAVFGPDAATAPIPSGIRVVDLASGELREIPVPGEEGMAVSRIAWSPDGRWLAFTGRAQGTWTRYSMGTAEGDTAGPRLGRIAPGATTAEVRRIGYDEVGLLVDDRGAVRVADGSVRRWEGGRWLASRDSAAQVIATLGTTPDRSVLRLRLDDLSRHNATAAVLVPVDGPRRPVIDLDLGIGQTLSVATDLLATDHPTVDRPEPDWPTDWGGLAAPGAWLLGGIVVVVYLIRPTRWAWRRARRSAP